MGYYNIVDDFEKFVPRKTFRCIHIGDKGISTDKKIVKPKEIKLNYTIRQEGDKLVKVYNKPKRRLEYDTSAPTHCSLYAGQYSKSLNSQYKVIDNRDERYNEVLSTYNSYIISNS